MAKEGEKRTSRVAVGSERKKNLTRPMRSKHPETPKRLTKSIILSLSIGGVDPRYRRTILSTCLYVDSVTLFPFPRQHTHKNELSRIMQLFSFKRRNGHATPHTSGGPQIVVGRCLGTVPFFHQKLRLYIIPFSRVVLK